MKIQAGASTVCVCFDHQTWNPIAKAFDDINACITQDEIWIIISKGLAWK